jgi:hypothetical protein
MLSSVPTTIKQTKNPSKSVLDVPPKYLVDTTSDMSISRPCILLGDSSAMIESIADESNPIGDLIKIQSDVRRHLAIKGDQSVPKTQEEDENTPQMIPEATSPSGE